MGVTILEHDDIYYYSISNYWLELAMLRYKEDNNYFISDSELSRELSSVYLSTTPVIHNEDDVRIAKERILELRKNDLGNETTNKSEPSSSMLIRFCFNETMLHNIYNFIL